MNQEINKYLTEAMGLCWHEFPIVTQDLLSDKALCFKCQLSICDGILYDFSTWQGFGTLWEWAIKQEWWDGLNGFMSWFFINEAMSDNQNHAFCELIVSEKFANAIFKFLKERGK